MWEPLLQALVTAAITVIPVITGLVVVWLKSQESLLASQHNADAIGEVHHIVNSQRIALLDRIDALELKLKMGEKVELAKQTAQVQSLRDDRPSTGDR
jgi:hypothetical protein